MNSSPSLPLSLSLSLEQFGLILRIPFIGQSVFTIEWDLSSLSAYQDPEGPYHTELPTPDDIHRFLQFERVDSSRILRGQLVDLSSNKVLTKESWSGTLISTMAFTTLLIESCVHSLSFKSENPVKTARSKRVVIPLPPPLPFITDHPLINLMMTKKSKRKITILKTNMPYSSRKIRRICACTYQRPQRKEDQYDVSRRSQYAILKI
ncbi:hypothetical protein Tco_1424056, partial [Tanacetum coccineum]